MTDIIDFEDKRKEKLGNQKETMVEESKVGGQVYPDSGNDSEENIDSELDSKVALKAPTDKSTQAERLIRLSHDLATFFHTPSGEPFGCVQICGHQEIWPLKSNSFKFWLRGLLYKDIGKMPYNQALQDALMQLEGDAHFNGPCHEVFIRVASHNNSIYIDMANENWEQIEISEDGWLTIPGTESPVKFRRTPGMLPIPDPDRKDSVNILGEFLNLESEAAFQLIVGWLIGAIKPDGPFPILLLQGEQGSAKSTTARLLKSVIDPSSISLRTLPNSERDLIIAARNCWILNFDNLSGLNEWMSDALCRIATGSGFGTRTLHTDDSESLFSASRPIIMNGISDIATRNDLAERCLIIQLPAIKPDERMTEKELKMKWEGAVGCIRAALFDAVAAALRNIGNVNLRTLPRMADFAKWVTAAEPALPWENGAFINEYEKNSADLVDIALDADPVATAVLDLVKQVMPKEEWEGSPSELLEELKRMVPESIHRRKIWPQGANVLSNRLRRAQTFLRKKGIEIERSKSGARKIMIRKISIDTVQTVQAAEKSKNDNSSAQKNKELDKPFSYTIPKEMPLFSDHAEKCEKDDVDEKDGDFRDKCEKNNDSNSSFKFRIERKQTKLVKRAGHDFPSIYRPRRISEVYGQNGIKEIVKNGLNHGDLARSLFFYGVSGTGKTTMSRIIGMGLLCKEGPKSEPCCECYNCKTIMKGYSYWGYTEINAADCSGLDFMRDLRKSFYSYPMSGDKQIFVFDESHNISKKAQDLLLKEVEDSPDHNYFIFCSTEPEGMLETLRNRCEPHEFKEMASTELKALLYDVCYLENVDTNNEIIEKIINKSKGMARNALVLLRKEIAAGSL